MFSREAFLRLNIVKTIDELLKLINEKVSNKDADYVEDFKKRLIDMQEKMKEE